MNLNVRLIAHALLLVLGLTLLVGGIVAGKPGATLIGLLVAAVNIQQYLRRKKGMANERLGHAP